MDTATRSTSVTILIKFWFVVLASLTTCAVGIYLFRLWSTGSFDEYRRIASTADVDSDGDLDVILVGTRWEGVATSFAGAVIWLNQGNGKFVQDEQRFGGFSSGAGDADQDGDLDLLVLDGLLNLYLNQGGAQGGKTDIFEIHNPIRPKTKMEGHFDMGGSVTLGDLDNDGDLDGLATNCCYGAPSGNPDEEFLTPSFAWVWLNEWDPRGWLVRHSYTLDELDELTLPAAALGDLDGDGDLDAFAVAGKPRAGLTVSLANRVLLNDGTGMLADSGQRLGESDSTSVALGDVDGDGDLDALVGARDAARLWINQGGEKGGLPGTYNDYAQLVSKNATSAVFLHDLDSDADLDAVIAGTKRVEIWWNDGQGNFTPADQSFPFSQRQGLAVGDFNGDRLPEIFIAEETGYKIWFLSPP